MNNLIKGKKYEWETIIGLEIHAQVKSSSKLFSSSSTKFGLLVENTSLVMMYSPSSNSKVVEFVIDAMLVTVVTPVGEDTLLAAPCPTPIPVPFTDIPTTSVLVLAVVTLVEVLVVVQVSVIVDVVKVVDDGIDEWLLQYPSNLLLLLAFQVQE